MERSDIENSPPYEGRAQGGVKAYQMGGRQFDLKMQNTNYS